MNTKPMTKMMWRGVLLALCASPLNLWASTRQTRKNVDMYHFEVPYWSANIDYQAFQKRLKEAGLLHKRGDKTFVSIPGNLLGITGDPKQMPLPNLEKALQAVLSRHYATVPFWNVVVQLTSKAKQGYTAGTQNNKKSPENNFRPAERDYLLNINYAYINDRARVAGLAVPILVAVVGIYAWSSRQDKTRNKKRNASRNKHTEV